MSPAVTWVICQRSLIPGCAARGLGRFSGWPQLSRWPCRWPPAVRQTRSRARARHPQRPGNRAPRCSCSPRPSLPSRVHPVGGQGPPADRGARRALSGHVSPRHGEPHKDGAETSRRGRVPAHLRGAPAQPVQKARAHRLRAPRSFSIHEEFYVFAHDPRPHAHVLVRLDTPHDRPDRPLVWCRRTGRGRVFYDALGHFPQTWSDSRQLVLVSRGIAWAAGLIAAPSC